MTVIETSYYKDFHCLSDACENTCCQGWSVTLTRDEYVRTQQVCEKNNKRELFDKAFKRREDKGDGTAYADYVFDENRMCHFLSEGLCSLQQMGGYQVLSHTCKSFPRSANLSPVGIEHSCSTGCEEVMRLLTQLPQGLVFEEKAVDDITANKEIHKAVARSLAYRKLPGFACYAEIQALCICILQNREYSLPHRMILLGLALQDLTDTDRQAWVARKCSILQFDEQMKQSLESLPANSQLSEINALIIGKEMTENKSQIGWAQVYERIEESLGANVESVKGTKAVTGTVSHERYEKASAAFDEWMSGREYIFENLLVNFFFHREYPLRGAKAWDNYMFFCNVYNFFRVNAIGYLYENASIEALIKVWTLCSRCLLHSTEIITSICESWSKSESDTLAHMAMLVKG